MPENRPTPSVTLRMLNPSAQLGVLTGAHDTFREVIDRQIATRTDLASVWSSFGRVAPTFYGSGHHWMSHPQQFADPWTILGYVAAAWPEAHLNSGFIQLPLFSPIDVAEKVVTIDRLARAGATFVVGLGWRPEEFAAAGTNVKYRVSRFEEIVETCRALWAGEEVPPGRHFTVAGRLGALPREDPTLVFGVQSPAAARRAARLADGLNVSWVMDHDSFRRINDAYREELHSLGRPAPRYWALSKFVSVDEDDARARARLDRMTTMFDWYSRATTWTSADVNVNIAREREAQDRTITGTAASVVEQLVPHATEFPYTDLLLTWLAPGTDPAENREHFAYLCESVVVPLLDELAVPAEARTLRI
ncbi:LLM class flavin-dependent oxidoreductase [Saccharopolyspora phatthalungensis]|uniref:Alkanesulfonate monooxygenase SsuD/methylene tetrahydromethanopterin reductase-like flavin-dependent oxidoreductase (Luciferase family) n=1 Tax=Saccharopolyspora phatthalungensis TaxID=664693 RepID=A0A840QES5_9PSEU|nr:LLM class flavin-dependent oxidoreductase [Saccharopolyspora phatthalungensis]MBB5158926.1 alkanesulfonate monooxygenase SsuD/methylene tetrahydromethanopterin reductase-like flavin-dependent oxidoreductase (luciferase family) [Saccharopolyspora phatthalungensis]